MWVNEEFVKGIINLSNLNKDNSGKTGSENSIRIISDKRIKNLLAESARNIRRFTKRGSNIMSGYAAELIHLKEKTVNVPSLIDGK